MEFDNGIIDVLRVPSKLHQIIMLFLRDLLKGCLTAGGRGGRVLVTGYRLRIPGDKFREPDVMYMTATQDAGSTENYTDHADLVIEIVSPDDPGRDNIKKTGGLCAGRCGRILDR